MWYQSYLIFPIRSDIFPFYLIEIIYLCLGIFISSPFNEFKNYNAPKKVDTSLELDPGYAYARYYKGLALQSLDKYAEAQACFDKAKEHGNKR